MPPTAKCCAKATTLPRGLVRLLLPIQHADDDLFDGVFFGWFAVLYNDADVIFISSICPETFSFTTVEAIAMNIPVACFDLGGRADHVRKYKRGLVISKQDAKTALDQIMDLVVRARVID